MGWVALSYQRREPPNFYDPSGVNGDPAPPVRAKRVF